MAPLFLATQNAGKISELKRLFAGRFECFSPASPRFASITCPTVIEDADNYFENALKKAVCYQRIYGMPVLADDSGLEVDALDGKPGVHTAEFGKGLDWPARWAQLGEAVRRSGAAAPWTARFRCVLAYYDGSRVPVFCEGVAEGEILAQPRGEKGFGYDPIFFSRALGKTFSEAKDEEKSRSGHRGSAARMFLAHSFS